MNLTLYTERVHEADAIHNFTNLYYSLKMRFLASDLLDKGLSPKQITEAVTMSIKIAKSAGIELHKHFMPVYSGILQGIIKDCKLSRLGYGMVLMNADPSVPAVGKFRVKVLQNCLDNDF